MEKTLFVIIVVLFAVFVVGAIFELTKHDIYTEQYEEELTDRVPQIESEGLLDVRYEGAENVYYVFESVEYKVIRDTWTVMDMFKEKQSIVKEVKRIKKGTEEPLRNQ